MRVRDGIAPVPATLRTVLVIDEPAAGVRRITLDRPERRNALTPELYEAIADAYEDAAGGGAVSAVVLTGAGAGFCAGADRDLLGPDLAPDVAARAAAGLDRMMLTLAAFPKPYLAAVNGAAVGAGAGLLLHADLVVMGESARVRFPFASLGLAPEAGASVLLAERVGRDEAAWLLFSAQWLDASGALARGLAWRVVPDDELVAFTVARAAEIASMPIASLRETKRLLVEARPQMSDVLARERAAMTAAASARPPG